MDCASALEIYAIFTGLVYLTPIFGGLITGLVWFMVQVPKLGKLGLSPKRILDENSSHRLTLKDWFEILFFSIATLLLVEVQLYLLL